LLKINKIDREVFSVAHYAGDVRCLAAVRASYRAPHLDARCRCSTQPSSGSRKIATL
jgi:hypothetical protein